MIGKHLMEEIKEGREDEREEKGKEDRQDFV